MDLWRVLLTLALAVSSNTFSGSWGHRSLSSPSTQSLANTFTG